MNEESDTFNSFSHALQFLKIEMDVAMFCQMLLGGDNHFHLEIVVPRIFVCHTKLCLQFHQWEQPLPNLLVLLQQFINPDGWNRHFENVSHVIHQKSSFEFQQERFEFGAESGFDIALPVHIILEAGDQGGLEYFLFPILHHRQGYYFFQQAVGYLPYFFVHILVAYPKIPDELGDRKTVYLKIFVLGMNHGQHLGKYPRFPNIETVAGIYQIMGFLDDDIAPFHPAIE